MGRIIYKRQLPLIYIVLCGFFGDYFNSVLSADINYKNNEQTNIIDQITQVINPQNFLKLYVNTYINDTQVNNTDIECIRQLDIFQNAVKNYEIWALKSLYITYVIKYYDKLK